MESKYSLIYGDIADKISTGAYRIGSYLPSENHLSQLYGASRETIRKVLATLLENGVIQKIQGKGSIVLNARQLAVPLAGLHSYTEIAKAMGFEAQTKVIALEATHVSPAEFSHAENPDAPRVPVTHLGRIRLANGAPVSLDHTYVVSEIVADVPLEAAQHSLFSFFENDCGLKISYAKREITIEQADMWDAQYIGVNVGDDVAVIRSEVFLEDTRLLMMTKSQQRADYFRYVDFSRRQ